MLRYITLLIVLALALTGCGNKDPFELAHAGLLPDWLDEAQDAVRTAYRFALANEAELRKYPCYCGCGKTLKHKDNFECYVSGLNPNGSLKFDNHASACGVCVDITLDVMKLLRQGKKSAEIRAYIDDTYAKYGEGTDTAMPGH